jgi:hypothetical protein
LAIFQISLLGPLYSAPQQDDEIAIFAKVDSVSRANINPQFERSMAFPYSISKVSLFNA